MSLLENISFNIFLLILVLFLGCSCAVPPPENGGRLSTDRSYSLQQSLALPQQKPPPQHIQSIQLHPKGKSSHPPVVTLGTNDKLILSFDYLEEQNRQFRVEVTHRTQDWEESAISPSVYLDSFSNTYIQHSLESFSQRPTYQHVEYEFPNTQLNPIISGNYLLEIYSYQENNLLFSIPFFITENEGDLRTRVETRYAQREDRHSMDQLFSTYRYPEFVEFPQFDLSISYVQNQFWGRMYQVDNLDTISPGELNGHLPREHAFISDYNFKFLNLRTFDVDGQQIVEYLPEYTPPRVLLRRDVQNLEHAAGFTGGNPIGERSGNYAQVSFFLETDDSIPTSAELFIVGDFNNWIVNRLNKLTFNSGTGLWEGTALIKQGTYSYKYIQVRNNQIDDLALDDSFLSSQQEYMTFIYFEDPTYNYDRILKVEQTISR